MGKTESKERPSHSARARRMIDLIRSFHVFGDGCAVDSHIENFELAEMDRMVGLMGGSGARHAMAFLWNIWAGTHATHCGPFNFAQAWASWDREMRAAWTAWAASPWVA